MTLETLFDDKSIKAKAKSKMICEWILTDELPMDELLAFTKKQKASDKATCIEAIESATKKSPKIADETLFEFVTKTLNEEEPRVKWESAKVIANVAKLYPENLSGAIKNLLLNANSNGTVVRWATALALGEILKLKTEHNKTLLKKIIKLAESEEDNGVKQKYLKAILKVQK